MKGMKHINIMWTADIRMKWRCDHCSCDCDLSNHGFESRWSPKTFFGLTLRLLKLQSQLRWSRLHCIGMSAVHVIFISSNNVQYIYKKLSLCFRDEYLSLVNQTKNGRLDVDIIFAVLTEVSKFLGHFGILATIFKIESFCRSKWNSI